MYCSSMTPHSSPTSNSATNAIAVVSGEPPKEPVFSKAGHVFEKHLLDAYLAEHNTDPITHEPATLADYVPLQVPKIARPRPANLTSLPSLLSVFQSEWDALALETFSLRKQLLETRQELSTALYQHDAACRVIARLERERNDAREALAKVSVDGIKAPTGESMDIDSTAGTALPDAVASRITQYKEEASATRKKRKLPTGYATLDSIRGIHVVSRGQRIHTGFCTVALDPESQYNLALFGPEGALNSIIYDLGTHEWKGQLSDDQGDIQDVEWYKRGPVTAGSNGSISVWSPQGVISFKFEAHAEAVVGVQLHPVGDLLMSAAANGEWGIHDPAAKKTVAKYPPAAEGIVFRCSDIHPDGHVYVAGCEDGTIHVYDVLTGELKGTLGPRPGAVHSIHCSQNGYWVAETSTEDSHIRVWDLRKSTIAFELDGSSVKGKVRWDHGGQYLALGGDKGIDVFAYQKKEKGFVKVTDEPLEDTGVKCLDWGKDGVIACGGLASGDICLLGVDA